MTKQNANAHHGSLRFRGAVLRLRLQPTTNQTLWRWRFVQLACEPPPRLLPIPLWCLAASILHPRMLN